MVPRHLVSIVWVLLRLNIYGSAQAEGRPMSRVSTGGLPLGALARRVKGEGDLRAPQDGSRTGAARK